MNCLLYTSLGLPRSELAGLAENLRLAQSNPGENNFAALMPQRLEQLRWLGLSARSLALLGNTITLLPARTPVNLNTASAVVLYACIAGLDMAQALSLIHIWMCIRDRRISASAWLIWA